MSHDKLFSAMGRGVIVVYRPKKGKDHQLMELIKSHVHILRTQKLAADRNPIIMKATDGSMIEIFEWLSAEAIQQAHQNKTVHQLWEKFGEVCDYEIPANVKEFNSLFSEFEIID